MKKNSINNELESDLPAELASPARRALAAAGYTHLEQLTKVTEAELSYVALDENRHPRPVPSID